jgi:cell division septum initiation protein DivIVA
MSEALHQLLALPERITSLDASLSDDGSDGSRLKAALLRVDRDKTQIRYMNSIIDNINDTALEILENAAQHSFVIEKHLKNLAEDVLKKHPEMVRNWRELNSVSKDPLSQQITRDSQRMNCFIQLVQLFVQ